MTALPEPFGELVDALASMRGSVAVVLGGSRAIGTATAASDWDIGVYYRGALDATPLARFGTVHPPGSWGRIMNGGAWLTIDGIKVDVLLRDLDVVEPWCARAFQGEFEVDALLGYVAGVPTYSLLAERAVAIALRGELPHVDAYPEKLAEAAAKRWRYHSAFSLEHARMHAQRSDVVAAVGQVAKAVIEEAHARACEQRRWVLNEKGIVRSAALAKASDWLRAAPSTARELVQWVADVRAGLLANS